MHRRVLILLGLAAFALSTSGGAAALHHWAEHCEPAQTCAPHAPSDHHDEPADEAPTDDRSDDECDLCATLTASRHAIADLDAPPTIAAEPSGVLETRPAPAFHPGVSLTTGPPRAPPFAS